MSWFDHFILTRFNVRVPGWAHQTDDDWLRDRISLFEQYCVTSVANQTSKEFRWLVFFDVSTPGWARDRIERIAEQYDRVFEPVYIDHEFTHTVVAEAIEVRSDSEFVATTRIDNDDAIAHDFVEVLQNAIKPSDREFINLVDGAQVADGRVYSRPYTSNPFITLVEKRQQTKLSTVFIDGHDNLASHGVIRNVYTKRPMWIQVVHGQNVANEVVGLRHSGKGISERFPVDVAPIGAIALISARAKDAVRIIWRLIRKPKRLWELAKVATRS